MYRPEQARQRLTIYITEATGFAFLGVMEPACPIDRNVALVPAESCRSLFESMSAPRLAEGRDDIPMDPPADMEQKSKRPSNTGQSSPTLSTEGKGIEVRGGKRGSLSGFLHFNCSLKN